MFSDFCRRDAYTCWPQNTGAEEFNYGSRIDHILCAGSCLHQEHNQQGHNFFTCHINECDILTQYKRWKPGNSLRYGGVTHYFSYFGNKVDVFSDQGYNFHLLHVDRWKGGQRIKLEGSDHAPVYTSLLQIPSVPQHNTPPLSARYIPMIYGIQQTLGTRSSVVSTL